MIKRFQVFYISKRYNKNEYIFVTCVNIHEAHKTAEGMLNEKITVTRILEL